VRSSIVGVVIWVVVAVAGLLLLIAITRRVLTRIRSRSARPGAVAGT
jgi:beta-lactamase regulating signal transducer with metallopeptidase domain